jgi:peptidoglycan/LPS O-acetylase OafA/YrhL
MRTATDLLERRPQAPAHSRAGVAHADLRPGHAPPADTLRIGALDGLRAVAVAMVVVYHFWPRHLPSGFLGVDVFMVLSGFLITGLLVREREATGRVHFGAFFGRRFRRLVPAVLLLIATVALWTTAIGAESMFTSVRSQGLAALGYVANWRLVLDATSYGTAAGGESPLVHLWSLGVEEQFYLLWPPVLVLLLALGRGRHRVAAVVASVGAISSAALMAAMFEPGGDPFRVYYGTDTRAQAFLVGSIAALVARHLSVRAEHAVAWLGLGALAAVMYAMTTDAPGVLYRGGFGLVAIGAALAVVATTVPGPVSALLGVWALRGLGRVSYGIYLWHWPAGVLLTPERVGVDGSALAAVRLGVTALGAGVSWMLLERPLRRWSARRVVIVGVLLYGGTTLALATLPTSPPVMFAEYEIDRPAEPDVAVPRTTPPRRPAAPPRASSSLALPSTGTAMIVGDSGMASAAPAFSAALTAAGWRVVDASFPGVGLTHPAGASEGWAQQVLGYDVDLTIVMLGGWDVGWVRAHGDDAYRAVADDAVRAFRGAGGKVLWLSVLPGGEADDRDLEHIFGALPGRHPGAVEYLDIEAALRAPEGGWPEIVDGRRLRGPDGWHLCPDGAAALTHLTLDHIGLDRPGWGPGDWRVEERYVDPPGVCLP